jgi:hypothetical protein
MFTAQLIRDRVRKQPFVPVRVVTSSGQTYDVYHFDMIWIGHNDLHVGMPSPDDPTIYDSESVARIAILHITARSRIRRRVRGVMGTADIGNKRCQIPKRG